MDLPLPSQTLLQLLIALGAGLLIGAERSWRERHEADGDQSAGIRSYALAGLMGGLGALLSREFGVGPWLGVLAALVLITALSYLSDLRRTGDQGITSELALIVTFLLGSLAMTEHAMLAAGSAVVVALLLSLKETLQASLRRLNAEELSGTLKLLFISVVLLPALPNQGYGPWQFFNPYTTWWMVVLIAALGFTAYVAIRLVGTRHGLMLTTLLGGLVSSTAMTLTLARLYQPSLRMLLAAGLLATSALMFPRILLEVAVLHPALLPALLPSLVAATLAYVAGAAFYWFRSLGEADKGGDGDAAMQPPLKNPFELQPALRFALLLATILFLVEAGQRYLGDAGIYLVSLLAGLTDVDAITLSLSRSAHQQALDPAVAVRGIVLAAFSNSLVKAGLIALVGGAQLARLTWPFIAAGLAAAWILL